MFPSEKRLLSRIDLRRFTSASNRQQDLGHSSSLNVTFRVVWLAWRREFFNCTGIASRQCKSYYNFKCVFIFSFIILVHLNMNAFLFKKIRRWWSNHVKACCQNFCKIHFFPVLAPGVCTSVASVDTTSPCASWRVWRYIRNTSQFSIKHKLQLSEGTSLILWHRAHRSSTPWCLTAAHRFPWELRLRVWQVSQYPVPNGYWLCPLFWFYIII